MLRSIVDDIKLECQGTDFNSAKRMINQCSYYALVVASKLESKGIESAIALIWIDDVYLNSTSPIKTNSNTRHNHNVVICGDMVIDITRKQFGDLVDSDVMNIDRYLSLGWKMKKKTLSSTLNLSNLK